MFIKLFFRNCLVLESSSWLLIWLTFFINSVLFHGFEYCYACFGKVEATFNPLEKYLFQGYWNVIRFTKNWNSNMEVLLSCEIHLFPRAFPHICRPHRTVRIRLLFLFLYLILFCFILILERSSITDHCSFVELTYLQNSIWRSRHFILQGQPSWDFPCK